MSLYIPFIHKIFKKEKFVQVPLYIDNIIPTQEKQKEKPEKNKEPIVIIELF